jgi:Flp pilus assembly protein TadG
MMRQVGGSGVTAVEFALLALGFVELGLQVPTTAAVNFGMRAAGRLGIAGTASVNGRVVAGSTQRQAILPRRRIIGNSRPVEGAGLDD